jgi:hypothetical protein
MMVLSQKLNYDVAKEIESMFPSELDFGEERRLRQLVPVWIKRYWGEDVKIDSFDEESLDFYNIYVKNETSKDIENYHLFKYSNSKEHCYEQKTSDEEQMNEIYSHIAFLSYRALQGRDSHSGLMKLKHDIDLYMEELTDVHYTYDEYEIVVDEFDPDCERWILAMKD